MVLHPVSTQHQDGHSATPGEQFCAWLLVPSWSREETFPIVPLKTELKASQGPG